MCSEVNVAGEVLLSFVEHRDWCVSKQFHMLEVVFLCFKAEHEEELKLS